MTVNKTIKANIEFTPEDLAIMFCEMDNDEQAEFFNCIGDAVRATWKHPFCFQMSKVRESEILSNDGLQIMKEISMYGD
jgi:hypothetical protein